MSVWAQGLALVALWLLAWGDLSLANVLSGALLAGLLLLAFPTASRRDARVRVHPVALVRLVLYLLWQLVTSNVLVARQVLARRSRVITGVIAHEVQHPSDAVTGVVANLIALTPGTMTVEATRDPDVLYVHFLLLRDVSTVRADIARLERFTAAALGGPSPGHGPEPAAEAS